MRLRLVHSLSLLLLGAVAITAVAMGASMALNLRHGFSGYLLARDVDHLDQLAAIVEDRVARGGGLDGVRHEPGGMREYLDELAQRDGIAASHARPPGPPDARPPPPGLDPPEDAGGFGARVALYDLDGTLIAGRPQPRDGGAQVERPIHDRGAVVGTLRMMKSRLVPDAIDADFLRDQYAGILGVALGMLVLAVASAWWFAQRWTRPLREIQRVTERIARGQLDDRLVAVRGDELGDVMRNVNTMAEGLQRLERSRRRWLADISHELRTPLTVLQGELEAIADGVRPLDAAAVRSLRDETLQLRRLVDDLHLLAMSDLQALPCRFVELEAGELIASVLGRFAPRAAEAGLAVERDVPAGAPVVAVCWDPARIEQLLTNVLENSVRYTDAPGRVRVAFDATAERVAIDIDDSAPGVGAADRPRLFDPLYRVDATRGRNRGGSGLGLAICEAIVRAHGGTIAADGSPLGGLRVRIALPVRAPAASREAA